MKKLALVVAGVVLGATVALSLPALGSDASSGTSQRTVTVNGTAMITAQPDEAVVTLGVRTEATTAEAAMQQNAAKMTAVLDALKALGIGNADIGTSNLSLDPRWNRSQVTGFVAVNQVDVTLHDLSKVGATIDAAVHAGANLSSGITFRVSDTNKGMDTALQQAVANARSKADTLATAAGASLGAVQRITENTSQPGPMYAAADALGASTPINAPTIQTQVTVTVVWSLT